MSIAILDKCGRGAPSAALLLQGLGLSQLQEAIETLELCRMVEPCKKLRYLKLDSWSLRPGDGFSASLSFNTC